MPKTSFPNQTTDPFKRSKSNRPGQNGNGCPVCGHSGAGSWLQAPDRFHGRLELFELFRCPSSSLVWLHDPPPPSDIGRHYGADYDRTITSGGADPEHWNWRRDELLRHKSSGAILDLGCSSGGFLASFRSPSWKLFGIEMSETVAKQAEARCGAQVFVGEILDLGCSSGGFLASFRSPSWKLFGIEMSETVAKQAEARCGAQVFVGDILDAPFRPETFDAITCFHVFEHLYQPRKVLARVSEWLKPGGIFYTMMPNIDSAGARIFRSYWYPLELPRHLYHFSPTTLRRLADSVGLDEVSLATHREVCLEDSLRYVLDDVLGKLGVERTPMAHAQPPSLAWRVLRKALRLTILPILTSATSLAGDGESIHAVLIKPTHRL